MSERTAEDFVNDMIRCGRSWLDIMAVGRVVRNGRWRNDVKDILLRRKLMPEDEKEAKVMRDNDIRSNRVRTDLGLYHTSQRKKADGPTFAV
jgi:hypothetical protein